MQIFLIVVRQYLYEKGWSLSTMVSATYFDEGVLICP